MLLTPAVQHSRRGFTLVEVMIAMTLLAILLTLAIPSLHTWIINGRIRATAGTIADGLRQARAEALKRNKRVAFQLCGKDDAIGNNTGIQGSSWIISLYPQTSGFQACKETTVIDQDSGAGAVFTSAGSAAGRSLLVRQTSAVKNGIKVKGWDISPSWSVSFDGFGRPVPNPDAGSTPIPTNGFRYDVVLEGNDDPSESIRPFAVLVSPAGQIRVCDTRIEDPASPNYCTI